MRKHLHFIVFGSALLITVGCQKNQLGSGINNSISSASSGRTQIIQATASDPNGVTKVEFYVNGALVPNCTITTAPYNCPWQVPVGAGIPYQLQTKAYDAQGKVGTSQIVNVTSQ